MRNNIKIKVHNFKGNFFVIYNIINLKISYDA